GIKIYPYDRGPVNALARHGGTFITQSELKQSLDPILRMRKAAGDEIEIALDLSSRWNLPCSLQIAHSLEPYGIMWLEDPMLADNLAAYHRWRGRLPSPSASASAWRRATGSARCSSRRRWMW